LQTKEYKKAYLLYHLCVFLWGFTAIFGEIIKLHTSVLVWYRMGFTTIILFCIPAVWKSIRKLNVKIILQLTGIGFLVTCHWIAFYGSIKESNVSVALTCLATTSLFVSLLEPFILKRKFIWHELILAVIVIPAIYLVFKFSGNFTIGIILGLISTLFATLFSILNKKMITRTEPFNISVIEIGSGFLILSILLPFFLQNNPEIQFIPSGADVISLILFSGLCTVLPFTLSLYTYRYISVFTASVTLNLEPVYGIILAIILFNDHEHLEPGFYAGTLIILLVVFINPFIQKRFANTVDNPVTIGE
jgi:drug/metabolite transporter (DMT)-like permease